MDWRKFMARVPSAQ